MKKNNWFRLVPALCAVLVLSGCALSNSRHPEPIDSVWKRNGAVTRSLFFATDREPAGNSFGLHWGAAWRCGRADITIPAIALPGENPAVAAESCDSGAAMANFARRIHEAAQAMHCNSVLLVIHGYNATFATSLLRAGQLALDTQWRCTTLMFGWSSEGKFDRYAADLERSGYAVPALISLMQALNMAGLKVDVITHSIGARIALGATGALCQGHQGTVDQMILAAADVSAEQYNDDFGQLLKRASACLGRTTIYASEHDMALMTSESFHGGVPRAGRVPLRDLQYGQGHGVVDVVDASLAPGDRAGHSYFTRSYEMARDMMWVLAGTPATERAARDGAAGQTLTCAGWEGSSCAGGRYVLTVAREREPDWGTRLIRHVWPAIFPVQ
ncbi:MAG: alpha/beta hydrolase [Rhizomicrobium sp.]